MARADVHDQAFNTGSDELNHQVREIGQIVADTVPNCQLAFVPQPGADQRTYKADFGKFKRTFPGFEFRWNARSGAQELYAAFKAAGLTQADFKDARFTRLRWLRHLMDSRALDGSLHWTTPEHSQRVSRGAAEQV